MTRNGLLSNAIPHWFLQSVRVLQHTDRGVRDIDIELRRAMALDDLDPRLYAEMQLVRDALGAVKVSLSVLDMTAKNVLQEIGGKSRSDPEQAAGT